MDFKAAFDKVSHKRLLAKMDAIGRGGKLLKWIENFLNSRYQRVVLNGTFLGWNKVTSGVPQGSVLGPVLFLIYINDLPDKINIPIRMFADDTKMYNCIKNKEDKQKLQSNILQACTWAAKWQMTFNVNKCKTMHLGTNVASEYLMKDNDKTMHKIQQVNQEKDL